MTTSTKRDVIAAAMSVAEDVAESRLDPAALDQAVADQCRQLFGEVVGEGGDPTLWPFHIDVCRQVLAVGGLTADELSEWLAVARSRAGEPIGNPRPPNDSVPAVSTASKATSPNSGAVEAEAEV